MAITAKARAGACDDGQVRRLVPLTIICIWIHMVPANHLHQRFDRRRPV